MRSGQCPKCGSHEVYSGADVRHKSNGYGLNSIPISGFLMQSFAALDNYVCVNCGYVESYVAEPHKLQEIARKWRRVTASPKTTVG